MDAAGGGHRVTGISHVTLLSRDLERMARLLCVGLGAAEVYDSGTHHFSHTPEKFFLLGGVWIAVMQGEPPPHSYQHVAFSVPAPALPDYRARLEALGARVLPGRSRVDGEGDSLYFIDFDGHLLELHSGTLEQRLAAYRERTPPA